MKPFSRTDRGRTLKKMYDTWVYIGKFDLAKETFEVMKREQTAYIASHRK